MPSSTSRRAQRRSCLRRARRPAARAPPRRRPGVGPAADLSADGSRLAYIYEYFLDGIQGSDGAAVGVDGSKPVHLGRASLADATFLAPDGSTMIWAGLVKDA